MPWAEDLIAQLCGIARVIYVTGNHEYANRGWRSFRSLAERLGATVLDNSAVTVTTSSGAMLTVAGISDLRFFGKGGRSPLDPQPLERYRVALKRIAHSAANLPRPHLLLAHRPEHFTEYADAGFDLVLSGHAHGGQFRLPVLGPLYSPDQGFLPKLAQGMHRRGNSVLVVSRGLGNSNFPVRLFNPPEIVIIDIPMAG